MILRTALFFALTLSITAGGLFAASPHAEWIDVPFVAQTKDGCGSAVISMVLRYWNSRLGRSVAPDEADPERIQASLASPEAGGIAATKMRDYFRAQGYRVYPFRGEWSDLRHHIDAGRPLIVSVKASGPLGPLHYVVVVGIDVERDFVYLNDPAQQKTLRISREGFESEWNSTHRWTLLALPQSGD